MHTSDYFAQDRPEVASLVPADARLVLDVGCGAGVLGARVRAHGARVVVGVEGDPVAVEDARGRLDEVICLNLDDPDSVNSYAASNADRFDCMIAADVLEHLRDPWEVLGVLVTTVRPGGSVIVSIPNVRVLSVVLPLVACGRFGYSSHGVLDRTHLRFFTRSSAVGLLEQAGLKISDVSRAPTPWRSRWKRRLGELLGDLGNEQFLLVASRPL